MKKTLKTTFWNIGVINLAKWFLIDRPLYTLKANNFHKTFTNTDQANVEVNLESFSPENFNNISVKSNMTQESYLIKLCISKNDSTHSGFLRTERKK